MNPLPFRDFFKKLTSFPPYPYQVNLAAGKEGKSDCESLLIDIPPGMGKTAAVVTAWLWNRVVQKNPNWPRRLVYCLPMRTLVEQTQSEVEGWLNRSLEWAESESGIDNDVKVVLKWLKKNSPVILMGGKKSDKDQAR